jgi:hypothetical protein
MSVEARFVGSVADYETQEMVLGAAAEPGDVLQYYDGRACVLLGADDAASGDTRTVALGGTWEVLLTNSTAALKGSTLYWDESANTALSYWAATGDFFLGVSVEDVTAGTSAKVMFVLNGKQQSVIDLHHETGPCTIQEVNGLGVTMEPGGCVRLELDNTCEQATASFLSGRSVPVTDKWICEAGILIDDDGTSVTDFVVGMANDDHASDADSITEFVGFSFNGGSANIYAESADGTTHVGATDTLADKAEGTEFHVWIDARDNEDIQLYVNAANVLPASTFKLDKATGPMKFLAQVEKTASTETFKARITYARVRRIDDSGTS